MDILSSWQMLSDGKERDLGDVRNDKLLQRKKSTQRPWAKYGMNQMSKEGDGDHLNRGPGGESLEHYEGCWEEALSGMSGPAVCRGQGGAR